MQEPCIPIGLLLASLAHCGALEARIAELTRPKAPEDFGLVGHFSIIERRVLMALLPPGEIVHRDALIARTYADIVAAGLVAESAHMMQAQVCRLRMKLGPAGWRLASAHGLGEYVLLRPDDPLPAGFRAYGGVSPVRQGPRSRACPECAGHMSHDARRCFGCHQRLRRSAA